MEQPTERPSLRPETARKLSRALDGIDSAKSSLRLACQGTDDDALVEAGDAYLDARDAMGDAMAEIDKDLKA
jgi:hypothetical protein